MRRTSTDKQIKRNKSRTVRLAASALALTASLAGATALADHKEYSYDRHDRSYKQDHYRYGPIYWNHQQKVRVKIPVRDHGPETLPIGRLIRQNSNVDLDHYRLVAVVTKNGRYSNGYASLRTGNSKTQRYFLGSREKTRIPAPSRADGKWRLRLGPGTQVRSVTAVLEPRRHSRRQASTYEHGHHRDRSSDQVADNTSLLGLAWLLANADDDKHNRKQSKRLKKLRAEQARTEAELAATQRKLDRSRDRNKRLKDQRARLAEELAHEQHETRSGKQRKSDGDRKRSRKNERPSEEEVRRTVRYVVSAK